MQPTVFTKASGLDVLAVVPYQLGFQPKDSLVVIALRPPRGRLGMMTRFDLTPMRQGGVGREQARRLLLYLQADGANGAFVIRYASVADGPAHQDPAMLALVPELARVLDKVACWDVVGHSITPLHQGSLQAMARSYTDQDVASTRMAATMVAQGATFQQERADLALLPQVAGEQMRLAGRCQRRVLDRLPLFSTNQLVSWRLEELARWRRWLDRLAKADQGLDQVAVPASELGHMGALLQDITGRDAVLVLLTDQIPGAEILTAQGESSPDVFSALATPGHQPSDRYLEAAPRLLALVAAHQAKSRRSGTLALMAWFAWWHSDGARAAVLAEAALALPDPPSLARLVRDLVQAQILPAALRLMADHPGVVPASLA